METRLKHRSPLCYAKGYPSLAAFIASDKEKSTQIYRRFTRLGARNLLYLQDELAELEARLDEFDYEDFCSNTDEKAGTRNFEILKRRAGEADNTREKKRLEVITEIRLKMKEYREAVFLEKATLTLEAPSKQSYKAFWNIFFNTGGQTAKHQTLGGYSANVYDDHRDLIALYRRPDEDKLTGILRRHFAFMFVTQRTDSPLTYISESRLNLTVAIINTIVAAVLLFGAVLNLYLVNEARTKLGLVAGYTLVFALCVGLVTNASRAEVFASCAAYSAVLVVFISGNLGSSA